jgi:hypothetical protein
MVLHRDAAPDSGKSTPDIRGLAAFDSLTVTNDGHDLPFDYTRV